MAAPKRGLGSKGQGLEALINTELSGFNSAEKNAVEIDINIIEPKKNQPRQVFEETALEELAASIKEYGVIQPIILKLNGEYYEIVAGERRWRAAKIAGLKKIPAIIKDYDNAEAFEVALVENLQRENLNPMEEALCYKRLAEELNLSQEEIGLKIGKSRPAVANSMRLMNLDPRVQKLVMENKLTGGHARTLLGIEDGDLQLETAKTIIDKGLSVRETENLVSHEISKGKNETNRKKEKSPKFAAEGYKELEKYLKTVYGTKVRLINKKNKGKIELEYYSEEDLERLIALLRKAEIN